MVKYPKWRAANPSWMAVDKTALDRIWVSLEAQRLALSLLSFPISYSKRDQVWLIYC